MALTLNLEVFHLKLRAIRRNIPDSKPRDSGSDKVGYPCQQFTRNSKCM